VLPRISATIERFRMLVRGEQILVAVSGGPDSVALLHALLSLRSAYDLSLHVAHVNHHLRPEASDDAAFVSDLAGALGLPFTLAEVDGSPPRGDSVEAWARRVRYRALEGAAREVGACRIALGHTADDQAETVLMRLLQGAGPRGLGGIPPVRGPFIRPLIEVSRAAVLTFLKGIGARWVDDRSNDDLRYLRNRLRLSLLPELARYNPGVRVALQRVGEHCREAWEAVARLGGGLREASAEGSRFHLGRGGFQPVAVVKEALRQWAEALLGRPLRQSHVEALIRLAIAGRIGATVRLPGGAVVERDQTSGLLFHEDLQPSARGSQRGASEGLTPFAPPISLQIPGLTELRHLGLVVEATLCSTQGLTLPRGPWSVAFDREALHPPLELRSRRPGDRFRPFGLGGTTSLKKFFNEARVPRGDRDRVPLMVAWGEIVWVIGHRRGAAAPVKAGEG
jgi:tRNA(Ile)-lysidine synthase